MRAPQSFVLLGLLALEGCGGEVGSDADDGPPPSVILISLDTCRAGHMSVYGYDRETTPFLEQLAEESAVYDHAISASCWTLTSHMSMLTGVYPEQHGVRMNHLYLNSEVPTLAQRLEEEGYQTLSVYKEGWIHERFGFDRGFGVVRTHEEASQAGLHMWEELDQLNPNLPFFMFLHLFDIHSEELEEPDDPFYLPAPPFDTKWMADAQERLEGIDFEEVREGRLPMLDDHQLEALIALYDGNIAWIDSILRGWWAEWEGRGLLEDTLVVITSDHGESLGQRGRIKGHGSMFLDGVHVPMIVRYPDGHLAGERPPGTVSHVDIVPTILDVTGFEIDGMLPGYSMRGEVPQDRIVKASKGVHYTLVQWPRKMISNGENQIYSMFDLESDPLELSAEFFVAAKGPVNKARMKKRSVIEEFEAAFTAQYAERPLTHYPPVFGRDRMPQKQRDKLKALGYAGEVGGD